MSTTCTLCRELTVARQYIRIVPATPDEETEGGFSLGERLRFHIRHTPDEVAAHIAGLGPGVADAHSYKLNYNPPWQVAATPLRAFVKSEDLIEALAEIRDRVLEWFRSLSRAEIVQVTAAAACADDAALPDMIKIHEAKTDDELHEKCLNHAAIERLQRLQADRTEATAAASVSA